MNRCKFLALSISARLFSSTQGKIVFYHDVVADQSYSDMATPLALFARHCQAAQDMGYSIVENVPTHEYQLQICFDDGFRGIWDCRDFFINNKIFPTIFLAVDLIGRPGYLTLDEILEMQQCGFHFESHGWSHRDLTTFSRQELTHELSDSRKYFSDLFHRDIRQLCFPIGYFSAAVLEEADNAGYDVLYSSIPGNTHQGIFPKVVCRNLVQSYSAKEFELVLRGGLIPFYQYYLSKHYKKI